MQYQDSEQVKVKDNLHKGNYVNGNYVDNTFIV